MDVEILLPRDIKIIISEKFPGNQTLPRIYLQLKYCDFVWQYISKMADIYDVFGEFECCEHQSPDECKKTRMVVTNGYVNDDPDVIAFSCTECGCKVFCYEGWDFHRERSEMTPLMRLIERDLPKSCCLRCDMKHLSGLGYKACIIAHRFDSTDYYVVFMCRDTLSNNKAAKQ